MAEYARTSREFASAPPHADAGTRQWISSLLPVLQRGYMNIRTVSSDTRIDADDTVIVCNTTSNSITITLPPVDQVAGKVFHIKKITNANTVTVDGHGGELVDEAATQTLTEDESCMSIVSDGTVWRILGGSNVGGIVFIEGEQTITGAKTFNNTLTVDSGGGTPRIVLDGSVENRPIRWDTNGVRRWQAIANAEAEGGSNTGSDFHIQRFDDSGNFLDAPLTIDRATAAVGVAGDLTVGNDLTVSGDILPQGDITLNVAGQIYARGSTFAPGSGNEFDGVLALGAGARVYLAALQYSADNDQNSLRIYTHPSSTGADPSELTAEFRGNPISGDTGLMLRHKAGGVSQFEVVSVGATDSGGSGYRVLRIPN